LQSALMIFIHLPDFVAEYWNCGRSEWLCHIYHHTFEADCTSYTGQPCFLTEILHTVLC